MVDFARRLNSVNMSFQLFCLLEINSTPKLIPDTSVFQITSPLNYSYKKKTYYKYASWSSINFYKIINIQLVTAGSSYRINGSTLIHDMC